MGWCQEFGAVIRDGCGHGMTAAPDHCECPECGVRCPGKFEACSDVWASGAAPVSLSPAAVAAEPVVQAATAEPVAQSNSVPTDPVAASRQADVTVEPTTVALPQADERRLDELDRMVAAIPRSVATVLAEARAAQHQDLADTADQLAVVLAKRVAFEVDRLAAARTTPLAESLAEVATSVQAIHGRLDALERSNRT